MCLDKVQVLYEKAKEAKKAMEEARRNLENEFMKTSAYVKDIYSEFDFNEQKVEVDGKFFSFSKNGLIPHTDISSKSELDKLQKNLADQLDSYILNCYSHNYDDDMLTD